MTPATHAAVAALVATRFRNLALAVVLAFGLHFVLDAVYHFEAFYELSVAGAWSYERAMVALFGGLGLLAAPVFVWLWRKNRQVWWFACYAFLLCLVAFEPLPAWRLGWATLLSLLWWLLSPNALGRRWVLCSFVAYLPDCLKKIIPAMGWLHDATHYNSELELGDWVSLLARGRWKINPNARIFDLYYQIGYSLEILLEAAILFGCLYWLVRRLSVADLPAVDNQRNPVDERSLVRK
ncbi:MAG TPA: hypothetical protein VEU62_05310 [Bryobacterales bacterium]|nr:hypothetical protein [Bryobacterales bacterium]